MADGSDHRELRGPAKRVHEYVTAAIARIQREAKTAVESAISGVRPEIDRLAREAAEGALAEARAAKEAADSALSQASAMNDETRRLLEEIKRRQEEHDDMLASFEDLDGDGIPDALQGEAPAPAPAQTIVHSDADMEEIVNRIFDRVIETLKVWRTEGGQLPVAIPANDAGGVSFREGSPAVVSGKKMRWIVEKAVHGVAGLDATVPMIFALREILHLTLYGYIAPSDPDDENEVAQAKAHNDEVDERMKEIWKEVFDDEDLFNREVEAERDRRIVIAQENGDV